MQAYFFPFFVEHVSGVPKCKFDVRILTLALAAGIVLIAPPVLRRQIAGAFFLFPGRNFVDKLPRGSRKQPERFAQAAPIHREQIRQDFTRLIRRWNLVARNFLPFFAEQQRRFLLRQVPDQMFNPDSNKILRL
jgi:hypothetical protein